MGEENMKTSIEIEFKTLVDEGKYEELIDQFNLRENIFYQVNHYFDTPDFYLRKNGMALRIRFRKGVYKLTLKRPHENCLYEDSIVISEAQANEWIKKGLYLTPFDMNIQVFEKASQETYRAVTPYKDGLLFFDKSIYGKMVDYEIEYEASEYNQGLKNYHQFLEDNNIEYKRIEHKIERVYKEKGI